MKKIFPMTAPGKDDARVRDKLRHEVNKYLARERRKTVPEGFDHWDFNCRAGADQETSTICAPREIGAIIDTVAAAGGTTVYIEIIPSAGKRRFTR
ncbi:MAG: hypothetical protein RLZZ15_3213 [Verrucomicrobiota bacterium]|jgi:hypothetical protein